jgi:hypothetical protein
LDQDWSLLEGLLRNHLESIVTKGNTATTTTDPGDDLLDSDGCWDAQSSTSSGEIIMYPSDTAEPDQWEEHYDKWVRIHRIPRSKLFYPSDDLGGPPKEELEPVRETKILTPCGSMVMAKTDSWDGSPSGPQEYPDVEKDWRWTGTTTFYKKLPFLAWPDRWEETPAMWVRVHSTPRLQSFHPYGARRARSGRAHR